MLFVLKSETTSIEETRNELIEALVQDLGSAKLKASLIFDSGKTHQGHFPHRHVKRGIEIIFSPHGTSADHFIIEMIEQSKNPKDITLVTDDRELKNSAKDRLAHTMHCEDFLHILRKKNTPSYSKEQHRNPKYDDYLRTEFEKRLDD